MTSTFVQKQAYYLGGKHQQAAAIELQQITEFFRIVLQKPVRNEGGVHGTCAMHNVAPANIFTSILVHILSNVRCTKVSFHIG